MSAPFFIKPTGFKKNLKLKKKLYNKSKKALHKHTDGKSEFMNSCRHYFSADNEDAMNNAEPINPQ